MAALEATRQRLTSSTNVIVHCDGACQSNPGGPGGWGAVIDCPIAGRVKLFGSARRTTNNRMELQAAIIAIAVLPRLCNVRVVSDSRYVVNGASTFAESRRKKMRRGKEIPNSDLWERLDQEQNRRFVTFEWVKGHNGHPENEMADKLASRGLREAAQLDRLLA
ncbi:hypothetical protein BSZ22_19805 [Bradyrhizobium canariense]|uniref:ribonuclease H n=2 Tax=Bradyrhizobium canariense TaxID=255045 RepID=A0A1X3GJP7_9BRAD|nr:hypothetical protein BSZ22_19805 [Bradyrhizobium canariense]OSI79459.1 hypothetical protein BSZ23_15130 [Bradyrhizobium canariense]OSI89694.1 hypothetical protein BSZ25_20270 [Bradyrhizobium canariense]OSI91079.1 hypothetical protein BSZ24_18935 [Bradyrhizobium canariense]OSJ04086.1 hypothetical protein BSZ16_14705 [Bradyrhizobium canariense]